MAQIGAIAGYFPSRTKAESAISALKSAGFTRSNIGLAIKSGTPIEREGVGGTGEHLTGEHHEAGLWERIKEFFGAEPDTTYAENAPVRKVGEREIYGHEDVHESLRGMAVTDEQARYFRHRFGSGAEGAIVTVLAAGRESDARRILEQNGGDVGTSASSYDYGAATAATERGRGERAGAPEEQNIRLYGEVLRVHTDRVNRGEARLRKEVHTTNQTVEVPVTREELVVERVPVKGEQAAGSASFEEKEIRVPLSEEKARVEKQPVVREEVRVGKKPVTETEKFDEQVRSEDLKVDQDDITRRRKSA
jgi:uncharacterized protein (TIGR02271 family)